MADSPNNSILFFQADQWRGVLDSGRWDSEMSWESGVYPNGEQWVRTVLLGVKSKQDGPTATSPRGGRSCILARFHDQEPLDAQLMRLWLVLESARRRSEHLHLIIPYLPYSLQDRISLDGPAAAARVVTRFIEALGVDEVSVIDLHNPKLAEAWEIQVHQLSPASILADAIAKEFDPRDLAIVSPDAGALTRAQQLGALLQAPVLNLEKVRRGPGDVTVSGDVTSCPAKHFILVDDMINTGGTMVDTARLVRQQCKVKVSIAVTHGLFAANALDKLKKLEAERIWTTDSFSAVPIRRPELLPALRVVNVTPLLTDFA